MPEPATPRYEERLRVPWWLWTPALGLAALLAAEIHLGAPGLRAWVPYAALLPATAAALWWFGRIRVAVADGELRVDDAHVPVGYLGEVTPLDPAAVRVVLGPGADPLAFVVQRPWVRHAVRIELRDPADPTPYWVVSTRRPAALAAALKAAD